jgi:pectate lyase
MPANNQITKAYVGGVEASRIYAGSSLIWQAGTPVEVGTDYLVDYAIGADAYLYPLASRADNPRVPDKYILKPVADTAVTDLTEATGPHPSGSAALLSNSTGKADGLIRLDLTRVGTSTGTFLRYRRVDDANCWELYVNSSGNLRMYERAGGISTARGPAVATFTADQRRVLYVRVEGNRHVVSFDGVVPVIDYTDPAGYNDTVTGVSVQGGASFVRHAVQTFPLTVKVDNAPAQPPPPTLTTHMVDFISADGTTAHLYPYADRADNPRVAEKYVTKLASELNPVVLPGPVGNSSTGEMPQLTDANAYGFIDFPLTRVGLGGGNIAFYRNASTADRWELNTNALEVSTFRAYERTTAGGAVLRFSAASQFAADQTRRVGVRLDDGGHHYYIDGALVGEYATVGSAPAEATFQGVTTTGLTVGETRLFPLTVEAEGTGAGGGGTEPTPTPPPSTLQGYGSSTTGGAGGATVYVTNLNDSGAGSFREACMGTAPRIIKFQVGGTITLLTRVNLRDVNSFVTIDGSDAPSPVTFKGTDGVDEPLFTLTHGAHDVIVKHLRFRKGPGGGQDNISLNGSAGKVYNVVIDHCSFSYSTDENINCYDLVENVTFSWCIISEPLHNSTHPKGPHGKNGAMGKYFTRHQSFHHCLIMSAHDRSLKINQDHGTHFDYVNNVHYNNFDETNFNTDASTIIYSGDVRGNYWKRGPNSTQAGVTKAHVRTNGPQLYVADNITATQAGVETHHPGWSVMQGSSSLSLSTPGSPNTIAITTAAQAYVDVLAGAGATLPSRDATDTRVVSEVQSGTGSWKDVPVVE